MDNVESGMILDIMNKLFRALRRGFELLDEVEVSEQKTTNDGTINLDVKYQNIPFSITVDPVDENLDESNVTITCLDKNTDFKPVTEVVKSATPDAIIDVFKNALNKFLNKEEQELNSSIKIKLEKDGKNIIHAHTYSVGTTYIKAEELMDELVQSDEFIESIPAEGEYYEIYEDNDDIIVTPFEYSENIEKQVSSIFELLKLEYALWMLGQKMITTPGQLNAFGMSYEMLGDRAQWEAKNHIDTMSKWVAAETKVAPDPYIIITETQLANDFDSLPNQLENIYSELMCGMEMLRVNLSEDKASQVAEWKGQLEQYLKFTLNC